MNSQENISSSGGAIEALGNRIQRVKFSANTQIISEGAPVDAFYIICKGEVEITKKTGFGQTAKLSSAEAGETFGEMALITNLPRSRRCLLAHSVNALN